MAMLVCQSGAINDTDGMMILLKDHRLYKNKDDMTCHVTTFLQCNLQMEDKEMIFNIDSAIMCSKMPVLRCLD